MYITLVQLAERPGAQELAQVASTSYQAIVADALMEATLRGTDRSAWTTEQIGFADGALARINDAIQDAEGTINGFLRKRGYAVPLDPAPAILSTWARAITRYLLHKDNITDERTNPVARDYRDTMRLLQLVAEGKFSLGTDDPLAPATERDVQSFSAERQFSQDTLKDY